MTKLCFCLSRNGWIWAGPNLVIGGSSSECKQRLNQFPCTSWGWTLGSNHTIRPGPLETETCKTMFKTKLFQTRFTWRVSQPDSGSPSCRLVTLVNFCCLPPTKTVLPTPSWSARSASQASPRKISGHKEFKHEPTWSRTCLLVVCQDSFGPEIVGGDVYGAHFVFGLLLDRHLPSYLLLNLPNQGMETAQGFVLLKRKVI